MGGKLGERGQKGDGEAEKGSMGWNWKEERKKGKEEEKRAALERELGTTGVSAIKVTIIAGRYQHNYRDQEVLSWNSIRGIIGNFCDI